ncbi:beta-1,3-galactosyltransferase 2-like [Alligator sinensis]|uniref:Hexosyltransferase n=1 Tax=Alligator sinensis TaxID=38654 RepID=A0A1U7S326_ALLSI|nr:beta-1,3-galactosyltransferase 2-like [Alligator sinensis]
MKLLQLPQALLPRLLLLLAFTLLLLLLIWVQVPTLGTLRLPVPVGAPRSLITFQWEELDAGNPSILEETRGNQNVTPTPPPAPTPTPPPAPTPTRHPLQPPYPYPYRFLLNAPHKCKGEAPFLVMLVVSEPRDVTRRHAIRCTWGNESAVPGVSIRRLFLLGKPSPWSAPLRQALAQESMAHGDLLQQDFLDTYNNLTLKTLMGLEWVARYCPSAHYVFKADSDVFINVGYLVHRVLRPQCPPRPNFATGYIYRNTGPIRWQNSKWYVPPELYPNTTYPPYCGGPGYVLSGDLAVKVFAVAQTLQTVNMEDVFVGLCLHALGIPVTDSSWGLFNMYKVEYEPCHFAKLVLSHHYDPEELLRVWKDFQVAAAACPS